MKYLQLVKIILSLLPAVIAAIKAVEEAIPGEGKGEQKLAVIRGVLEAAYVTADDLTLKFEELWPALEKTIGNLVSTLNALGAWKDESQ